MLLKKLACIPYLEVVDVVVPQRKCVQERECQQGSLLTPWQNTSRGWGGPGEVKGMAIEDVNEKGHTNTVTQAPGDSDASLHGQPKAEVGLA